jgi:hypothetical protein
LEDIFDKDKSMNINGSNGIIRKTIPFFALSPKVDSLSKEISIYFFENMNNAKEIHAIADSINDNG